MARWYQSLPWGWSACHSEILTRPVRILDHRQTPTVPKSTSNVQTANRGVPIAGSSLNPSSPSEAASNRVAVCSSPYPDAEPRVGSAAHRRAASVLLLWLSPAFERVSRAASADSDLPGRVHGNAAHLVERLSKRLGLGLRSGLGRNGPFPILLLLRHAHSPRIAASCPYDDRSASELPDDMA
jgi:hypothetical protein